MRVIIDFFHNLLKRSIIVKSLGKNMKKKLLLMHLLFACGLYADTLTLQESINKTLTNHPDIKSFVLKIQQSQKNYNASFADYLPQINLQAEYNP
jgi:hypothetical protein